MPDLPTILTVSVPPHQRLVRMSIELMDILCTRDNDGNRLRVEWREAEDDGTYTPIIHVDYNDNPFIARKPYE